MDGARRMAEDLRGLGLTRRGFLIRAAQATAGLAAAGGASAALAACGGSGGSGQRASDQTLRMYLYTEPSTLDPNLQQYGYEAEHGRQAFEALLRPKLDLSDVEGAAAEGFTRSSDGLTYEFSLRKNAKWSDGKPVTASDFMYAFRRILNPAVAAPYADPFFTGNIKGGDGYEKLTGVTDPAQVNAYLDQLGLAAPDDTTFRITLQRPASFFKWVVSLWLASPVRKDVVEAHSDTWATDPKTAISNGWFKLSEYVPHDHVTLVANPNYWGRKPQLQKIVQQIIVDESKAFASYQNGELDISVVPASGSKANANNADLKKTLQLRVWWVDFNTKAAPFDNAKLRLAMAQAMDREKLVGDVLQGQGLATATHIPKGMRGYAPDLDSIQKFDPAAAKKLLQESGVDPASLNGVLLDYRTDSPDNKKIAEYLVDQLNTHLGLKLQANPVDSKTLSSRLEKGDYKLMALSGWGADYPDQQNWFDNYVTVPDPSNRGNNLTGWSNPDYDKLVAQADQSADESQRDQLYKRAHKLLLQSAPSAYLYQRVGWSLVKKYVKGLTITPIDDYPFVGDNDTPTIWIEQH